MDTKTFLLRVTSRTNELVISTHKPDPSGNNPRGVFWNRGSYTDLDAAVADIHAWDAEPKTTVYFGVGSFAGHITTNVDGKRKIQRQQKHAVDFKALALDLDIGPDKPYATQKEGWVAVKAALDTIGLPAPMVVSSGNGIHLYWPLKDVIQTAQWERISIALRVALQEHNVTIDTSKIHDPSMVLRPVGTHHKKQQPWKSVECKQDSPDYDILDLVKVLKPWAKKTPGTITKPAAARSKPKSGIASAILDTGDVDIGAVAQNCKQVRALMESGGVTDAAGKAVEEPLWRLSLGLAKYSKDPEQAILILAGEHPDFDLDDSMAKMAGWNGSGPPTCEKFEQLCPGGCVGCPSKGVKSPAQVGFVKEVEVPPTPSAPAKVIQMPPGYVLRDNEVHKEVKVDLDDGTTDVTFERITPFLVYITGVFKDPISGKSAAGLAIQLPHSSGPETEVHDLSLLAVGGKDFATLLVNRQVFLSGLGAIEKVRKYLMDYLTMVQQQAPSGIDYTSFGWQPDGNFMCGAKLLGPKANTEVRLRGAAQAYEPLIGPHGDRAEWVRAMAMLDRPGTETIRSATLLATSGLLGPASGNAQLVVSIYSTETTTGKTLSLISANSLVGNPRGLLLNRKDTANAMYKIRGVLNHLPACMDEVTTADDREIADMIYDFSQGREKVRMSKDGALRDPATWAGPTLMSTNISLHQKVEAAQAGNEPLKARCLELPQHDRRFVTPREGETRSDAYEFFEIVDKNNGWAFPELIDGIQRMGGPQATWDRAEEAFNRIVGFVFEPQERFYRTAIISAWALGRMGAGLGLFPFDIEDTIRHLCAQVERTRKVEVEHKVDVFDTIGQFLAEHNDQIVEARSKYGVDAEQVTLPAPERAVARVKIVSDAATPVMPGSYIAINAEQFRIWLGKKRDGMDRIERALEDASALIKRRERITMFKGCPKHAPGQAQCLIVNLNHPRFIESLSGLTARTQSKVTLAVLNGENAA